MDFGWPNVKIDQKTTNGQLLFLALRDTLIMYRFLYILITSSHVVDGVNAESSHYTYVRMYQYIVHYVSSITLG